MYFLVFSSAIVTGCDRWALYENKNYVGRCVCVHSCDHLCEWIEILPEYAIQWHPGFYPSLANVGFQIASVKKGCNNCNEILPPECPKEKSDGVVEGSTISWG